MNENSRGPHVLVVADEWDEDGGVEVVHPADCPREVTDAGYWFFVCAVGQMESDMGLDANFVHQDNPDPFYRAARLASGRYEIEPWFETHPGGPWGPTEYSAGLRLVAP